jgi:hypothetical protein
VSFFFNFLKPYEAETLTLHNLVPSKIRRTNFLPSKNGVHSSFAELGSKKLPSVEGDFVEKRIRNSNQGSGRAECTSGFLGF